MKNTFVIALLFMGIVTKAQVINFTDPNLKAKLLTNNAATDIYGDPITIDTNGNGEIEVSEALLVPNLNVSGANISSLDGIASFANLQSIQVNDNLLTTVDFSGLTNLHGFSARNNQLTSVVNANLPNLTYFDVQFNQLTVLDLSGMPALQWFVCKSNQITTIDVSNHTDLFNVECESNGLTSINVTGCTGLNSLVCTTNNLTSINVAGLGELSTLTCGANQLNALDLTGLTNLQTLTCNQNQITSLSFTGLTNLTTVSCSNNLLTSLDCSVAHALQYLYCDHNQLTSLNVNGLTNLINLICINNALTTLNVSTLTNLQTFYCQFNQITALDVNNSTNLTTFHCFSNNLTSLNVSNLNSLVYLYCWDNQLSSLTVTNNSQLKQLYCYNNNLASITIANLPLMDSLSVNGNQLTGLDVSNFPSLAAINCEHNLLTSLNIVGLHLIQQLLCSNNQLPVIDVSDAAALQLLYCNNNLITTLDLSANGVFCSLSCDDNPLLQTVFMKSGSVACPLVVNTFSNNPSLVYVCADEWRINTLNNYFTTNSMNVVVNSYCTFSPGGNYNTISGNVIYDANNNGCDANDILEPNIRIDINDQTAVGATFTNTNGLYGFFTQAGNFDIALNIENPSYFNLSPSGTTISFPDNNNNTATQNFCISANGTHTDLEVVITPITPARPGFDAVYKITYKNKGNTTPGFNSGVRFDYNPNQMSYVSSSQPIGTQGINYINFDYSNLMPFESRTITVTFHINSPTDTNPINIGDILNLHSNVGLNIGDENPSDNDFTLNQIVVGSFDPNSIECLEGDIVSPSEIGNYLHYAINFENLGTFQAENIVVRSDIDLTKYDISTLQVMDTSHPSYTTITGNVVEFIFQNINLAAAAGTPPVGGHGDVLFKIKSKNNLVTNDTVLQRAGIYFDYNFPVATNDAETTFAALNNPNFEQDNSVKIYPNPAHSVINIDSNNTIKSIELYDIQGRILEKHFEEANTSRLDISGKSKGVYFLKVYTESGIKVEKIVKE